MPDFLLSDPDAEKRRLYFTCVKDDDVNDFLQSSDMSTFTLKISKNGAASGTPSGTTVTQVSAADHKGLFYLALNAADINTLGRLVVTITNSGGTKAMRKRNIHCTIRATDSQFITPPADITKVGGTAIATPTTPGVMRVDVKAMETNVLTATAINADAITAAKIADGAIDLATFAADALSGAFGVVAAGTATAGSTTTMTLAVGSSAVDGAYADGIVFARSGAGALQVTQIDSYVGATREATFKRALDTAVGGTTVYAIFAGGSAGTAPTAAANAAAVWAATGEDSHTYGDLIRGIMAAAACEVTDFTSGTLTFKSMNGATTRITGVVDATGRISVTFNDLTD